ncbi:MAG: SDR family oxidoreductase [Bacteroidetes bacterium]|nr:SDR family oxidoreductase [Bacteroidota bacterium]
MKRKILITGATSGIGKATAVLAAKNGHKLFLSGRNQSALSELCKELHAVGYFAADVVQAEEVSQLVEEAKKDMDGIDVLLNNAGLGIFDPLENANLADWHTMIDVNIKGVLNVLHATLPHLIESKGHLINLGSLASHYVFPNSGIYCATKHAVFAISESVRTELAKKIRVTTISPGSVNTPFVEQTKNNDLLDQLRPSFAAGMPVEWVAQQIVNAIEVPEGVNVSEIIMRPFRPEH